MLQNRELLKNRKNLLAFSGGADSTALLFLLLKNAIAFDIAIVDYGVRAESKEEVAYAQALAKKYNFTCHLFTPPSIEKNFEANARRVRYEFFESLIKEHSYENLLTAHHLGDRFEWMLMQFCKGAGCYELSGMSALERRKGYNLLRPLLMSDKAALLEYLHDNNIHYFEDASNADESFMRNEFRHNYALPLLAKYRRGIEKSFEYLDADISYFIHEIELKESNALSFFESSGCKRSDAIAIDKELKRRGHLMSAQERRALGEEKSVVLGRKFVVHQGEKFTFIAPYQRLKGADKRFKEQMRLLRVDPKLRGYLSTDSDSVSLLSLLLA